MQEMLSLIFCHPNNNGSFSTVTYFKNYICVFKNYAFMFLKLMFILQKRKLKLRNNNLNSDCTGI